MENWIANPYNVEFFDSEEEDDEDDFEDNDEGDNHEEDSNDEEEVDNKEDAKDKEDELATNKGEVSVQGMNSPARLNKHIQFLSTSSSTPFVDNSVHRGSKLPLVRTVEPMI